MSSNDNPVSLGIDWPADIEALLPSAAQTCASMSRRLILSERKLRLIGADDRMIERIRSQYEVVS